MSTTNRDASIDLRELERDYLLKREIGRGGMSVVYLARHRTAGHDVAIKFVDRRHLRDPETVSRFEREARLTARLEHPNIVRHYDMRRLAGGHVALVMQYVRGQTLGEVLRKTPRLPYAKVERILTDIANALEHAHLNGVVHHDVKPQNIFIEQDGRALLSDFGIGKSIGSDADVTQTGIAIGTPTYMSPEQIDGGEIDQRADLYSLGIVGWELIAGKRPWEGESLFRVVYNQKHEPLPPLHMIRPDCPQRLLLALEGALEKNADFRWSSAGDFRAQLQQNEPTEKMLRRREALASSMGKKLSPRSPTPDHVRTQPFRRKDGEPDPDITGPVRKKSGDPEATNPFRKRADPDATNPFKSKTADPEATNPFKSKTTDPEATNPFRSNGDPEATNPFRSSGDPDATNPFRERHGDPDATAPMRKKKAGKPGRAAAMRKSPFEKQLAIIEDAIHAGTERMPSYTLVVLISLSLVVGGVSLVAWARQRSAVTDVAAAAEVPRRAIRSSGVANPDAIGARSDDGEPVPRESIPAVRPLSSARATPVEATSNAVPVVPAYVIRPALSFVEAAWRSFRVGRVDSASAYVDSTLARDPRDPSAYVLRARLRMQSGDLRNAWSDAEIAFRLGRRWEAESITAMIEARLQESRAAKARIRELVRALPSGEAPVSVAAGTPVALAMIAVGDRDEALDLLHRCRPTGPALSQLLSDPGFDPVRTDPRFQNLLHKSSTVAP